MLDVRITCPFCAQVPVPGESITDSDGEDSASSG